ncbi:uncharacterized protein TNCT_633321 [Trichonephila clavata]|uniref:Uncharacterized protein n=1 Tax=Trichonephila clavata TaxID=2740835 RepID=A0A8X6KRT7_TRICU|nr:uncharacterized protein TNCT_633321 [Trichonephila clavata]
MLRPSTDGQISSEPNNNVCYVNSLAVLSSSSEENTIDTNQTVTGYFGAFHPNTAETELHSTAWNQIEPVRPMETQSNIPQTSGSGYGVVKRRQKVAKGVQTDEVRKRCWRHRRSPLADKSRQSDNEETLNSHQGSKDDISSPNSSSKSVLRRALPNVNFSTWTRASKVSNKFKLCI